MLGRMAGAAIGAMFSKERHGDPVKGALIGAATMFVARRLLPARIAGIGATIAAGYVAKKLADRELAKQAARDIAPAGDASAAALTATQRTAGRPGAVDRTVPPTSRSSKLPPVAAAPEPATTPPATS